tara:strand:- start:99 stop:254 length:156 start_codon:yes stop_codon:yes gene_type:complete
MAEDEIQDEIQGEYQDQLLNLIGVYGEANLIKYLSESILDKEKWIREHPID